MACLQSEAVKVQKNFGEGCDCEKLKDQSFATHPDCYTERAVSFCTLPKQDVDLIFRTLHSDELRSFPVIKQSAIIVKQCIMHTFGRNDH